MTADVIIAGAGIVGLATAYQLQRLRPDWAIRILEKEAGPAFHQSGRNSGVVHTGVYYKPGSLKAKNCTEGRRALLEFCNERGVPYQKKHKLIVATDTQELPRLEEIYRRGQANGVPRLQLLSKSQVSELEPSVNALQALLVPECHIIDYKKVALALCEAVRTNKGEVVFNEPVERVEQKGGQCLVHGKTGSHKCRFFMNCTGLYSDRTARSSRHPVLHRIFPFRGEYYELTAEKRNLVKGLIYPVPDPKFPFLGVHLTPRIDGSVEAGPNAVLALSREGYKKSDWKWEDVADVLAFSGFWKMACRYWKSGAYEIARSYSKQLFLKDLRRLVPSIRSEDISPAGAGIRAQAVTTEGRLLDDFALFQEGHCLHVLNAPSPAATACFAIGQTLAEMAIKTGAK